MAIDTRSRRAGVLGVANPWVLTLPEPAGAIVQEDRQHVSFCYPGILAGESLYDVIPGCMNESIRAFLNALYSITQLDVNPVLDRYLDADALTDKTISMRELEYDTEVEERDS